ncbi:MAG: hypothetical protein WC852_03020 [Candidatus Nanoarchaeia archaeon]|jgi:hypothetical protein
MKKTKCINCGANITPNNICTVISKHGAKEFICTLCSKFTRSALVLPEVSIIPITKESFEKVVQKYNLYYYPMTYGRKGGRFIAFYVTAPMSAITHYAKVQKITINQPLCNLPGSKLFKKNSQELQKVYFLEQLKQIGPIKKIDKRNIQGTILTTLEKMKKAKNIVELLKK